MAIQNATARAAEASEAELVAGARRRDEAAIRAIIRAHNRTLFRLARSILPDDEAEEALQESYLRAFTGIAAFRGEASLRTWLCRIVLNEALARARRRRPTVDIDVLDRDTAPVVAFPLSPPPSDPERLMGQNQIRVMLEQAIDELPAAFRTVAVARLVEQMSIEETAELFGLKPETVKTRLFRARRLLRAALERRIGAVLGDAFPFAGERCDGMTDRVVESLRRIL